LKPSGQNLISGKKSAFALEITEIIQNAYGVNALFPALSMRKRWLLSHLILVFIWESLPLASFAENVESEPKEWGLPIYSIYSFDEIGVAMPGGRLCQDSLGRISIIEGGNYRVFDGKNWEHLLEENTSRHYLTVTKVGRDGQNYAGWIGSWGYLVDSKGRYKERFSIAPSDAPEWTRNCRIVNIIEFEEYVLFVGDLGAIQYDLSSSKHKYYPYAVSTRLGFRLRDRAYVASDQTGLSVFDGTSFQPIPKSEQFSQGLSIVDVSPYSDKEVLLASLKGGLFLFDGFHLEKVETEIDGLIDIGITAIEVLPDGRMVVAIRNHGLFVLLPDGQIQLALEREYTTEFAIVSDLMRTSEGVLWATLNNGVAKIFLENGITVFDHRMGLPLFWPYIRRLDNKIYVRTENEVYEGIYNEKGRLVRFEMLEFPGLNSAISTIEVHSSGLLLSCSRGVFHWSLDGVLTSIIEGENVTRIVSNPSNPDQIMVFGLNYNTMIVFRDGKFEEISKRHSTIGFPSTVVPDEGRKFWIELGVGLFGLIEIQENDFRERVFANVPNLPFNWINIWKMGGEVYFSSDQNSIVHFDPETDGFSVDTEMQDFMKSFGTDISRPYQSEDGIIWLSHRNGMDLVIPKGEGKYKYDSLSLSAFRGNNAKFTVDGPRHIWFAAENQLALFDRVMGFLEVETPYPQIYSVISMDSGESILDPLQHKDDPDYFRTISYDNNSLTFYVYPSNYALSRAPTYKFHLEGLSTEWSPLGTDSSISFTNLPEGNYKLWIQMYGQSEVVGDAVSFQFSIQPPIYRTWYAYFLYAGTVYIVLLLIVRKFLKRVEKENARLERLVAQRTKALDHTNDRLRLALRSAEHAAEAKSQFLANMSHEIRTPMNGVIGTVQLLKESPLTEDQNELLGMIDRSGNLLLHIINDILDYSKAEAGKIELETVDFNLEEMIESVLDILSSRIAESNISFVTSIDPRLPNRFIGDPIRLQQILINFCSNALKFTKNGHILLRIAGNKLENETSYWNLEFEVQDTGIGIPEEKMNSLFTPFSQLDASNARVFGGTGLGLAISDRLVGMMGSSIQVKSEVGKGSCFGFKLKQQCSPNAKPIVLKKKKLPHLIWIIDNFQRQVTEIKSHLSEMGLGSVSHLTFEQIKEKIDSNEVPALVLIGDPIGNLEEVLSFLKSKQLNVWIICYGPHPNWKSMDDNVSWMNQPLKLSRLRNRIAGVLKIKVEADPSELQENQAVMSTIDTSKKILIVEDSATNRRVLELMLKRFQVKLDFSNDGKEALDAVSNADYALIMMDIQLPGMDGIEVTRRIRASLPEEKQPVIIGVSANVMQQDITKALAAGMNEYMFKPIRISELHAIITKYL
jgi:signal transduction histidine kinase/CheY-like chemotaxis protein